MWYIVFGCVSLGSSYPLFFTIFQFLCFEVFGYFFCDGESAVSVVDY